MQLLARMQPVGAAMKIFFVRLMLIVLMCVPFLGVNSGFI